MIAEVISENLNAKCCGNHFGRERTCVHSHIYHTLCILPNNSVYILIILLHWHANTISNANGKIMEESLRSVCRIPD